VGASVEVVLCVAVFVLALPLGVYYLSGFGGRTGAKLLQASFTTQRAMVHGKEIPTTELRVVHRWRTHAATDRYGVVYAIDANWLCQDTDGHFAVAIGQGSVRAGAAKALISMGEQPPLEIAWTWRSLSDDRVRHMLTGTPRIYRKVFGRAP